MCVRLSVCSAECVFLSVCVPVIGVPPIVCSPERVFLCRRCVLCPVDAVLSALGHHSAVNTIAVLPTPSSTTSTSSTAAEPQPPLLASEGRTLGSIH